MLMNEVIAGLKANGNETDKKDFLQAWCKGTILRGAYRIS